MKIYTKIKLNKQENFNMIDANITQIFLKEFINYNIDQTRLKSDETVLKLNMST